MHSKKQNVPGTSWAPDSRFLGEIRQQERIEMHIPFEKKGSAGVFIFSVVLGSKREKEYFKLVLPITLNK